MSPVLSGFYRVMAYHRKRLALVSRIAVLSRRPWLKIGLGHRIVPKRNRPLSTTELANVAAVPRWFSEPSLVPVVLPEVSVSLPSGSDQRPSIAGWMLCV